MASSTDTEGRSTAGNGDSLQVIYLGISGVLHPSESQYALLTGRSPWDDGHAQYESAPVLEDALRNWPAVRIVLTSTVPWRYGLPATLDRLGPLLTGRVLGFTYEDLTTKATRQARGARTGMTRLVGYSDNDYWRMNKSDIVAKHVEWLRPSAWLAIDDEDILWSEDVRRDRLVLTDGCMGLRAPATMDRLQTLMHMNFTPGAHGARSRSVTIR